MHIPFNKPYLSGSELQYIREAVENLQISGNGVFTQRCQEFFEKRYRIPRALLTTSCTDALEMCALLLNLQPGDEVIIPSYAFVSCANAFALRGAVCRFADSTPETPNIDPQSVEALISPRTKAIVALHYAGVACEMEELLQIAEANDAVLIEDAAHAVESYYHGQQLGTFGPLSAFSFHETKNISCGEGGLLAINHPAFAERAEILWHKGTNRSAFSKGKVDKYSWVDLGSSFLPSDILAAYLWAQLENLEQIQHARLRIWERYNTELKILEERGDAALPVIPEYASVNGHLFYLTMQSKEERDELLAFLNAHGVNAVFHYVTLHDSPYFRAQYRGPELPNARRFSERLVRLPLFCELSESDQERVITLTKEFFGLKRKIQANKA